MKCVIEIYELTVWLAELQWSKCNNLSNLYNHIYNNNNDESCLKVRLLCKRVLAQGVLPLVIRMTYSVCCRHVPSRNKWHNKSDMPPYILRFWVFSRLVLACWIWSSGNFLYDEIKRCEARCYQDFLCASSWWLFDSTEMGLRKSIIISLGMELYWTCLSKMLS